MEERHVSPIATTLATTPHDFLILLEQIENQKSGLVFGSPEFCGYEDGVNFLLQTPHLGAYDFRVTLLPDGTWRPYLVVVEEAK